MGKLPGWEGFLNRNPLGKIGSGFISFGVGEVCTEFCKPLSQSLMTSLLGSQYLDLHSSSCKVILFCFQFFYLDFEQKHLVPGMPCSRSGLRLLCRLSQTLHVRLGSLEPLVTGYRPHTSAVSCLCQQQNLYHFSYNFSLSNVFSNIAIFVSFIN